MPYTYHHVYERLLCEMEAEDKQLYKNSGIKPKHIGRAYLHILWKGHHYSF